MIINYFLIFIFGLVVGSFLNCVIFRLKKGQGFLWGGSYCPHCKHSLAWYDLIPIFSFIILRRRCRYCQKPISWQYPLVEISTGLIFLLIFNFHIQELYINTLANQGSGEAGFLFPIFNQFSWTLLGGLPGGFFFNFQLLNFIYYLVIACFLVVIFVYDLKHFIIHDKVLYPAIVISLLYLIINNQLSPARIATPASNAVATAGWQSVAGGIINYLFAALGASAFFLLIYLFSKGKWLGFGDVKLGILLGLLLGWPKILLALFLSFVIGGIIGIGLIVFGKKKFKSEVPFAPFLIAATFIALFWGSQIINWYFSLMFHY